MAPRLTIQDNALQAGEVSKMIVIQEHYIILSSIAIGAVLVGCNLLMNILMHNKSSSGVQSRGACLLRQFVSLGDLICGMSILGVLLYAYSVDPVGIAPGDHGADPATATATTAASAAIAQGSGVDRKYLSGTGTGRTLASSAAGAGAGAGAGTSSSESGGGTAVYPGLTCYVPSSPNLLSCLARMPLVLLCIAMSRHVHVLMVFSTHQQVISSLHLRRAFLPLLLTVVFHTIVPMIEVFLPSVMSFLNSVLPSMVVCTVTRPMPSVYLVGATIPSVIIMAIVMLFFLLDLLGISHHSLMATSRSHGGISNNATEDIGMDGNGKLVDLDVPILPAQNNDGDFDVTGKAPTGSEHAALHNKSTSAGRRSLLHGARQNDDPALIIHTDNTIGAVTTGSDTPTSGVQISDNGVRIHLVFCVNALILVFPLIIAMTAFLFVNTDSNTIHCMLLLLRWTLLSVFNLLASVYYTALQTQF